VQPLKPYPATPPQKRKVLIVDDHPVVREGLSKRIDLEPDLVVCGEAQSPAEALRALNQTQPDIVVVDLALAEGHGLDLIKAIRSLPRPVPILVFTMFEEALYAVRTLQAGAKGYLTKQESPERLVSAIRTILRGDFALSPQAASHFLQVSLHPPAHRTASLPDQLGDRELQVFELMGKGLGTREIAAHLGRSIKTIETYRARIKRKLQVNSATALVREAVRWTETRR
jgi:DNA-binding NarL/FixJ family response regulator